ncbi:hypothetical protein IQ249_15150 [Lusitaniella coriacea LEGE 07157]|uniref:Uncharacterized protein n=1 Tax=Lusitaniella coriacea LEGE 07157 TaxID=945747 RepID=A0A8J7E0V3_9CYAN|nr:hypothetical protein [Lusitaniella coriacea]MBE9117236.1 hypothetical protein [Lusitaniella coriacea LEGE 07157]
MTICVVSGSEVTPEGLAELLEKSYFIRSDALDEDAYQQKDYFREEAYARAAELLLSKEEALKQQMEMVLEREQVHWLVPQGWRVDVTVTRSHLTVRVEKDL